MTTLNLLGICSFGFIIAFTYNAYNKTHTIGQSPRSAIIEAWINILIGFTINFVANIWLLPLVGAKFNGSENLALGCIYTSISMFRQYFIRRWFNAKIHSVAIKLTGEKDVSSS